MLNQKLKPDIAVLEGGYSVETALPYINMGIIMAMAGIDFSNLREPDYDPKEFRERPGNMDTIKALVREQLTNFREREAVVGVIAEKDARSKPRHAPYSTIPRAFARSSASASGSARTAAAFGQSRQPPLTEAAASPVFSASVCPGPAVRSVQKRPARHTRR